MEVVELVAVVGVPSWVVQHEQRSVLAVPQDETKTLEHGKMMVAVVLLDDEVGVVTVFVVGAVVVEEDGDDVVEGKHAGVDDVAVVDLHDDGEYVAAFSDYDVIVVVETTQDVLVE
jgi:hypothetical protein